jgi:hypothetical protein
MDALKDKIHDTLGVVPSFTDIPAQHRCFEYLKEAFRKVGEEVDTAKAEQGDNPPPPPASEGPIGSEDPVIRLKNQKRVLQDMIGLLQPNTGSYRAKSADMFWQYWDKIKEDAVKVNEGQEITADIVLNKLNELEEGRYRQNK